MVETDSVSMSSRIESGMAVHYPPKCLSPRLCASAREKNEADPLNLESVLILH